MSIQIVLGWSHLCNAAGLQQQKVKPVCSCSLWCISCTVSMCRPAHRLQTLKPAIAGDMPGRLSHRLCHQVAYPGMQELDQDTTF